jgi:hypothetical protein
MIDILNNHITLTKNNIPINKNNVIIVSNNCDLNILKNRHNNYSNNLWDLLELIISCLTINKNLNSNILYITINKDGIIIINYNLDLKLYKITDFDIFTINTNIELADLILNSIKNIDDIDKFTTLLNINKSSFSKIVEYKYSNIMGITTYKQLSITEKTQNLEYFKQLLYKELIQYLINLFYNYQKGLHIKTKPYFYLFISNYNNNNNMLGLIQNYNVEKILEFMYIDKIDKYIIQYLDEPDIEFNFSYKITNQSIFLEELFYKIDEETINNKLNSFTNQYKKNITITFSNNNTITYNSSDFININNIKHIIDFQHFINSIFNYNKISNKVTSGLLLNAHTLFINNLLKNFKNSYVIWDKTSFKDINLLINLDMYKWFYNNYYEYFPKNIKIINKIDLDHIKICKKYFYIRIDTILEISRVIDSIKNYFLRKKNRDHYLFLVKNLDFFRRKFRSIFYRKIFYVNTKTNTIKKYILAKITKNNYILFKNSLTISIFIKRYLDRNHYINIVFTDIKFYLLKYFIQIRYKKYKTSVLKIECHWINYCNRRKIAKYRINYYKQLANLRLKKIKTLEDMIKNILSNHKLMIANKEIEIIGLRDTIKSYDENISNRVAEKLKLLDEIDSLKRKKPWFNYYTSYN